MNYPKDEISKPTMEQFLIECPFSTNVIVLETVDSTNTYAKNLAQSGAKSGTCVIAKTQTNGRGRLGRSFFSPSDTGIYMSIILRPETEYENTFPYTIAACVAVCTVLEKFSDNTVGIKWVNDIFANGKKVCGILTESGTMAGGTKIDYYVIGIGINVSTPASGFPEEIQKIAGAVSGINASKNQIIASVISELLNLWKTSSVENIIEEYKNHSFILDKPVSYLKNGKIFTGTAKDINLAGNLIVRLDSGETDTLISGEVSLRSENFTN